MVILQKLIYLLYYLRWIKIINNKREIYAKKTLAEIHNILRETCAKAVESQTNNTLDSGCMFYLTSYLGHILSCDTWEQAQADPVSMGVSRRMRSAAYGKPTTTMSDLTPTINVLKEEMNERKGFERCKQAIGNLLAEFKQGTGDQSSFADVVGFKADIYCKNRSDQTSSTPSSQLKM